jgi:SOS response regulatory protein OraA/RecX
MWVRSRTQFKPKGERLIRFELQEKGIHREIIDAVFQSIALDLTGDTGMTRNELALAIEILEKKKKKFSPMERQERFHKAGGLLVRKGFSLSTIKKAIEEVFGK